VDSRLKAVESSIADRVSQPDQRGGGEEDALPHGRATAPLAQHERLRCRSKAYATRKLRTTRLLSANVKPWGRHGSTVYLWKEKDDAKAIEYVRLGQGDDLFRLDDDE
jgi:hypothetical protein